MPIHPSIRRPIEFIGFMGAAPFSEVEESNGGPALQPDYVEALARAHEAGDFDRVLIGYGADSADGWQIAAHMAQYTERLGMLIAHRPGFVQPTLAARFASSLDVFSKGRVAMHMITGGSDAEQARDGDFTPKEDRYARTGEYMQVLKKCWNEREPFTHEGRFYRFVDVRQAVRPYENRDIPLYFGGSTPVAFDIGARNANVYAMFGEPVADVTATIADIKRRAVGFGRAADDLGFSVSLRPILGPTEDAAWERAYDYLERIRARKRGAGTPPPGALMRRLRTGPSSEASRRLLAVAERGDVVDERLFMAIARETGAGGNSTAPVGTPEQVAQTILNYVDAGATTILIRGFEPLPAAIEYGRDLIPLVRQELAHRQRSVTPASRLAAAG
ncbi:MAG: LLM class flavin-dependent oxidoreductase [Dehalococcoidia bacterium]